MRYIYYAALGGVAIFFAYIIGIRVGNIKCGIKIANTNNEQIILNTKIVEETNEAVIHIGVSGVRRVLREKYTIAE